MAKQGKFQAPRVKASNSADKRPPAAVKPQRTAESKSETTQPEQPLTPAQKAWEIAKTGFTYLVMAISIAMMIFTAISVRSFDQNNRDLFGYKFFIVRSDSMSATDFSAGDLVVIKEIDPGTLVEGDIIAFQSKDPGSLGETFTHKIRSYTEDEFGNRTFITYGTTTGIDDTYPVPQVNVLGQYRFSVPKMGTFFAFVKTPMGYVCCIGIPFLLMLLIQGGSMITSARGLYKEKEEEIEAAHQKELASRQKTIDEQRNAMRSLYQTVNSLQERVDALEKAKDQSS